jgi:hypothetical protein
MGERGRSRVVEVFNWDNTGAEIEAVLERAVQRHGSTGGS